jgi:serine/threonine protein kinase
MEVLADALDLEPAQRPAFLERACAGGGRLREEVERLLGRESQAAQDLATVHGSTQLLDALAPAQVGRYKLLRPLGEGGMGIVYQAAQQAPVKRVVALKLICPGMDSREVIARFESERQALALMSHPNVAQVYDAGTTDLGRPYFVMEYVAGEPLTSYCDGHRAVIRERLDLFVQVCEAVQHAHQKGIIHRDLKPTNVLVAQVEGRAVPKVIDFGVAKAVQQSFEQQQQTMYTQHGQLLGTPEYMSPEQAHVGGIDVDTRTDIYSLGVLLYELLTGTLPIDSKTLRDSGDHVELCRTIREVDPPSPSRRLSQLGPDVGEAAARARRAADATALRRQVRGELDWIVMRAMEKDRARRYESAGALAEDVRRFLRHQPVLAGPPSTIYAMRKFAQRHRTVLASATLLVLVLIAGVIVASILAVQSRRAERRSREEATRSAHVAGFLRDMLAGVNPGTARGRDTSLLREILDKTQQRVSTDLKEYPLVEADLRETLGHTYYGLGLYAQAEENWEAALAINRAKHGQVSADVAGLLSSIGAAKLARGDAKSAEPYMRQSLDMRRAIFGNEHMQLAEAANNLASVLRAQGDLPGAETYLRETAALVEKLQGPEEPRLATTLANLAGVLRLQLKFDEAEAPSRRALAIRRKVRGDSHPETANSLNSLGVLMQDSGKLDAAEPLLREALEMRRRIFANQAQGHPDVAESLHNMSRFYDMRGDRAQALSYAQQAADMYRAMFGTDHPDYARSLFEVAHQNWAMGKFDESEKLLRESIAIFERAGRTNNHTYATALQRLGRVLVDTNRPAEAQEPYEKSAAAYAKFFPQGDWRIGFGKVLVGGTIVRQAQQRNASADDAALVDVERQMVGAYADMNKYDAPALSQRYAAGEMARLYESRGMTDKAAGFRAHSNPTTSTTTTTSTATLSR